MPSLAPVWWDKAIDRLAALGDHAPAALGGLFTDPVRCYELTASPGNRTVAVLGAIRVDKAVLLVVGVLTIELDAKKQAASWGDLEMATVALHEDNARQQLLDIAERLTPESLRARDPDGPPLVALLVGDLESASRASLTRRLWTYGVRVDEFLEQPYRNGGHWARERIRRYRGDLAILIQGGCGNSFGALISEIRGGVHMIPLAEDDLDLLAIELDDALDAASVDVIDEAEHDQGDNASEVLDKRVSVKEATARILELPDDEGRFVLTDRCRRRLKAELMADPGELAEQTERFRDFALRWSRTADVGGLGGDIVVIARTDYDLVLARTDEPMRRAKLDGFEHEGITYSRETHIKVTDRTSVNRVARIYFAFDTDHQPPRVVVDHIGSKISPYVKR